MNYKQTVNLKLRKKIKIYSGTWGIAFRNICTVFGAAYVALYNYKCASPKNA